MHGSLSEFGCRRCAEFGQSGVFAGAAGAMAAGPAWKSFAMPGAPTQWSRDRLFDVVHVKLDLLIEPDHKRISGTATHSIVPFGDDLASVELDCCELTVTKVIAGGKPATFSLDGGKLKISLAKAARKGKALDVAITYHGTPRRGIYFTGPDENRPERQIMVWTQGQDEDSRFWFPCFDFPCEKQTSEVIATIPLGMKALSNGRLLSQKKNASRGTETWHWKLEVPHVAYLVTLCVGDFEVFETKWKDVPVTYWSPKGKMDDVKRTLQRTSKMLTHFSDKTGFPYPYPQYAQIFVQDFIFGGMENTSATTLTDTAIVDRASEHEVWMDGLVAHELGHQWFGDLVTCRDWSQGWLNEGFASYMEVVWKEQQDGADEAAYYRMGEQSAYLDEDGRSYRRPIVCRQWHDPIEVFDRHLYQKGACVLAMLSKELSPECFWASIKHYLHTHKWGSVVTDDLRKAIETTTGRNLEWFFDQWVFHGGHPVLDVSWKLVNGQCVVSVKQTQKPDEMTPLFRFGLDLRVETDKGSVTRTVEITEAAHEFSIGLADMKAKSVKWVAVDPGAHLLHAGKVTQSDEQWAACLAGDVDAASRVRAARALGDSATPAAVKALASALSKDGTWFVRSECARALSAARSEPARDGLLASVTERDSRVRAAVASSLGAFRNDEKVAKALIKMLGTSEKSPLTLYDAAVALGRTRCAVGFDTLVAQLQRPAWNDMARRGATAGLGELASDDAIPVLVGEMAPDRPDYLRASAAMAVSKLGKDKHGDGDMIRGRLEDMVRGGHLRVQMAAIGGLIERRDPKALGVLHTQAERDLDGRVKRSAKLAATAISAGLDRGDDVRKLRDDVTKLRDEQRKLLDRLEKMESAKTPATANPAAKKRGRK